VIEFGVDVRHVESLLVIHRTKDLHALVAALEIDKKFLVKADLEAKSAPYVDMASTAELAAQSCQQALWLWRATRPTPGSDAGRLPPTTEI
jgi:hypothetical protein